MLMGTAFPPSPDRLSHVGGQASSGYVPERLHPPPSRSTLSCGTTSGQYGERYPSPPRWPYALDEAQAASEGFGFHEERFDHAQTFSRAELVAYLMTHSNMVAASDKGRETPQEIASWLDVGLTPFLPGEAVGQFGFGGLLRVLKLLA